MVKMDTRMLKALNTLAVLDVLRRRKVVSRAQIARETGLTAATVSSAVSELESSGIVRTVGVGESEGGRPPVLMRFNPEAFYIAGVDLGVSKAIAAIIDLEGRIVVRSRVEIDVYQGRDAIISALFNSLEDCISQLNARPNLPSPPGPPGPPSPPSPPGPPRPRIAGIGLSVPGLIHADTGVSVFAPNIPGWNDVPIAQLFSDRFGLPAWVENDARAMAIGEAMFGAGRGRANFLCVNVGRGIGSGIVIGGQIYGGGTGTAGELGHMTVDPNGPLCPCGNRGCLEVMAAGPAIAASAIRAVTSGVHTSIRQLADGRIDAITAELVSEAAQQGDPLARQLIAEAGRYLGIGIANAVNLLGPEIVVIGGGVARAGEILFDEVRRTVERRAFTTRFAMPAILNSEQGEEASAIGAAGMVFEKMISPDNIGSLALQNQHVGAEDLQSVAVET